MLIGDIPPNELARRLRGEGVHLVTGAFTIHVRASLRHFVGEFVEMYAHYPIEDPPGIDDASVHVTAPSLLGRYVGRQAMTSLNGERMFGPIPAHRAYTAFETSLNWGIAVSDVAPMLLHGGVLERDGVALIMPAASGSGKSTLAAALAWRGWRLLSDEMVVFAFDDGRLRPNPRPVSLKNKAIDVIAAFEPRARLSRTYHGTPKGDIAFMQAPAAAVARAAETVVPGLVVSPKYVEGTNASLEPIDRAEGFRLLTENAVNYASMLKTGFDIVAGIVERCSLYRLTYSDLNEAVALLDALHRKALGSAGPPT